MRRQRGITLLECLVSILVFGLGIFSAAQCLLAAYSTLRYSEQVELATLYAQQQIEQAVGFGTAPVAGTTSTVEYDPTFPNETLTINATAQVYSAGLNSLVQWTIDANWVGTGVHAKKNHMILQTVIPYRIALATGS